MLTDPLICRVESSPNCLTISFSNSVDTVKYLYANFDCPQLCFFKLFFQSIFFKIVDKLICYDKNFSFIICKSIPIFLLKTNSNNFRMTSEIFKPMVRKGSP